MLEDDYFRPVFSDDNEKNESTSPDLLSQLFGFTGFLPLLSRLLKVQYFLDIVSMKSYLLRLSWNS